MISLFSLDKQSESVYNKLYILDPFPEETSMFIKDWKKEILTIPNALTLFRLILIPVYVRLYLNASSSSDYLLAGAVLSISCLTDMIDGKIARHFNMISHLGKVLDPLADKMTQLALILCLSFKYSILYPVLALFLVKEFLQLFLMVIHLFKGKALDGALPAGKICTAVLFISLIFLVLLPDLNPVIVDIIVLTDVCFLLISFVSYVCAYFGKNKKIQDLQ